MLALILSTLTAGCGSGGTPAQSSITIANSPRALAAVVAASTATATRSAAVQMSLSGAEIFGGKPSSVRAHGAFDFARGEGSLILTPAAHSPAQAHSWGLVFLPKAAYSRPPPESTWELPRTKPWISIDLTQADAVSTNLPKFIPQIESLNPLVSLDELRWGAVAATLAGRTKVDGVRTTRYTVNVDLQSALNRAYGKARNANRIAFLAAFRAQIRSLNASLATGDSTRLQLQVWVDAGGRVVRLRMPTLTGAGTATMAFQTLKARVAVRPPAPSRSVAIASLGPGAERENAGGGDSDGA